MEDLLVYYACLYQGDYNKIKKAIKENMGVDQKEIRKMLAGIKSHYVTILDERYPIALRDLNEPPFVIFYYGDLSLVNKPCISMIGMRECNEYGKRMAIHITQQLRKDFVIVSGLAKGIDGICHQYANQTIAVLGCGIDYCYPKNHQALYDEIKENGLLISEYPFHTPPKSYYFPWRNRIVAALGWGTIVIQARKKSGTMITVGYALDLGRPVFALPCRMDDPSGTLGLIKDGAFCLESALDIYEVLNLKKNY